MCSKILPQPGFCSAVALVCSILKTVPRVNTSTLICKLFTFRFKPKFKALFSVSLIFSFQLFSWIPNELTKLFNCLLYIQSVFLCCIDITRLISYFTILNNEYMTCFIIYHIYFDMLSSLIFLCWLVSCNENAIFLSRHMHGLSYLDYFFYYYYQLVFWIFFQSFNESWFVYFWDRLLRFLCTLNIEIELHMNVIIIHRL